MTAPAAPAYKEKPGDGGAYTVRLRFEEYDHLKSVARPGEPVAHTLVRCMMETSGDHICYVHVEHPMLDRPGRMGPYSPRRAVTIAEDYAGRTGWKVRVEVLSEHVVPPLDPPTPGQREDDDE